MPPALPWILSSIACALLGAAAALWFARRRTRAAPAPSPEGLFAARPVFDAVERRVHRVLRDALPGSLVLARVPLRRICRPLDAERARIFVPRMATLDVAFLICSPSGRVLAAIDLERSEDPAVSEQRRFKAEILAGCRVRYLRCDPQAMPDADELARLVEASTPRDRAAAEPAPALPRRRDRHVWIDNAPAPLAENSWVGEVPAEPAAALQPAPPWVTPTRRAGDHRRDGTPPRRH
ncbi:DUF2726 domain-containing protein [Rubrivivax gelatinosus]|uniref:Uncharacterized protein DUF2726 n=1 Tax=Rubrivivax gelatinosus TaxID=28068 RepID=A0A4R2MFR8_RUBGE|nr:DUF2726 domain-containing protein [Rubrivivax gelatinosus]MBK1686713.1 hypothetical protein [Rubrivivax gelatinosus]TCP05261.1 uncharacterized protein DUF2726 [Rubrivivax gelatinosus]